MSRFDSFCASCGYQLTKDGEGWTGCQCAKLAELEERGVNIVDLDEENTRLRAALASIAALQTEKTTHGDDLVGRPRSSEVTEALRRERDALLARVEKLREALALMSDAESPCGPLAHTIAVFALGTDDTAAGKGVG